MAASRKKTETQKQQKERAAIRPGELVWVRLGGLFLFRNQVDLFRRPENHELLNRFTLLV